MSWEEVFQLARKDTQEMFQQAYSYFSDDRKEDLKERRITSQTPKAYSLPKRRTSDGGKTPVSLWEVRNPDSNFKVSLKTDESEYAVDDYLTLQIRATADCHITVLNWNAEGTLTQVFPNIYDSNNFAEFGKMYSFPSRESNFDFTLPGPQGRERFKIIATRKESDSQRISKLIPMGDDGIFQSQARVIPRDRTEAKILKIFSDLESTDWAEASTTIHVR